MGIGKDSELTTQNTDELRKNVKSKMNDLKDFARAIREFGNFYILDSEPSDPKIGLAVYQLNSKTAKMYKMGDERLVLESPGIPIRIGQNRSQPVFAS